MIRILKKNSEFKAIYSDNYRIVGKYFVFLIHNQESDILRAGIVCSKKVGIAVIRNKIRRRVKAFFRENYKEINFSRDIILIARKDCASASWQQIVQDLSININKIKQYLA